MPTSSWRPTASTRPSGNAGATTSRPKWICAPTASPGWAARAPSTPSPSSSANGRRASSSPIATSTKPAPAPGCWRPTPRPSPAPASTRWTRPPRARFMEEVFRRSWRATASSPTARTGAASRRSAARAGPGATSSCSATPRRPRISPSAPAPSSPWRTRSRCTRAFAAGGGVPECLARFEAARREDVERTQHAADVSLVWFEQLRRFRRFHPTRFAFGLMTRAKAITWDNLELRAPAFVRQVREAFAEEERARGIPADGARPPAFQPFRLRGMSLPNRARRVADVPVQRRGRPARRLPPGALRRARHGRRRPALHRDDLRVAGGAHHPRLHGPLERRPGGGLDAHRRFRPRATARRGSRCNSAMRGGRARRG